MPGAAAHCRREAGLPSASLRPPPGEEVPSDYGARDVETWMELLGGGAGPVYQQYLDRLGRHGYKPLSGGLTPVLLRDHWKGCHTLAVPVYDDQDRVRFSVLDLDVSRSTIDSCDHRGLESLRERLRDDALGILDLAHRTGVEGLLEESGYKGYHVWFFFHDRLDAGLATEFLQTLSRVAGTPPEGTHRELFPPATKRPPDGLGSRIKIPLGVHLVTGRRSVFIAPDGSEYRYGAGVPGTTPRNRAMALKQAIAHWNRNIAPSGEPCRSETTGADATAVEQVHRGCSVFRGLERKASLTRSLTHAERIVLRGILNPLGEEGRARVHTILQSCANYDARVTDRYLAPLKGVLKPMGCGRIREVLGEFCNEMGCDCRFRPLKSDYAHPLRHVRTRNASGSERPSSTRRKEDPPVSAPAGIPEASGSPSVVLRLASAGEIVLSANLTIEIRDIKLVFRGAVETASAKSSREGVTEAEDA
jgi:hypothetical protein